MSGTVAGWQNPSLYSQSLQADAQYGLPSGTTWAIAGTESSYGTNTYNSASPSHSGTVYQFGQGEEAQYGSGNSPFSAAAYIWNLMKTYGLNLVQAFTAYQNGPGAYQSGSTTPQYSTSSPFATFAQSLGYGVTGNQAGSVANVSQSVTVGAAGTVPDPNSPTTSQQGTPDGTGIPGGVAAILQSTNPQAANPTLTAPSPVAAVKAAVGGAGSYLFGWLPSPLSIGFGLLAGILILGGVLTFVFESKTVQRGAAIVGKIAA